MIQIEGKNYRYGKIMYEEKSEKGWNYGDAIQTLAVENVYASMNIAEEDIEMVQMKNLSSYKAGRDYKLILPMQGYFRYSKWEDVFPLSEDIVPVYIGYSRSAYKGDSRDYYRTSAGEYIGCRDEKTLNILKRKGINTFLSGCLTICFPRREKAPKEGKIFLWIHRKE